MDIMQRAWRSDAGRTPSTSVTVARFLLAMLMCDVVACPETRWAPAPASSPVEIPVEDPVEAPVEATVHCRDWAGANRSSTARGSGGPPVERPTLRPERVGTTKWSLPRCGGGGSDQVDDDAAAGAEDGRGTFKVDMEAAVASAPAACVPPLPSAVALDSHWKDHPAAAQSSGSRTLWCELKVAMSPSSAIRLGAGKRRPRKHFVQQVFQVKCSELHFTKPAPVSSCVLSKTASLGPSGWPVGWPSGSGAHFSS